MSPFSANTTKPAIVVVDHEASTLAVLIRELQTRYGSDYLVLADSSADQVLKRLRSLADSGHEVALILADQWMPTMRGVDLLAATHQIHPTARRALLINLGDRSAAEPILRSAALGQIDFYILKPVFVPDERFHRAITEFLEEWWRVRGRWFEVFRMVADPRSARAQELRDILYRNGVPFGFYAADSDQGRALLGEVDATNLPLPVLIGFDGQVLVNPTNSDVASSLGANVAPRADAYDLAIVGAGPAGLAAAVYGASEGLQTAVIEPEALGGQAGTSSLIRNYLGFPHGISGAELAARAYEQAWLFRAEAIFGSSATTLRSDGERRVVRLSNGSEVTARVVVIACGVSYRRLDVPELEALIGSGVFYGASVSEAHAVSGERVYVVGGGNSAGQAAVHLANYALQVTVLVRSDSLALSMSDYLINQIDAALNIDVRFNTEVVGAGGNGRLKWLHLNDRRSGRTAMVPAAAVFVLAGAQPYTDWLPDAIGRDRWGYVLTGDDVLFGDAPSRPVDRAPLPFETSIAGVFAVGDVRHGSIKRVASAVGEGSAVVRTIHDYLAGNRRPAHR